jgi:hypothetical protein
MLPKKRGADICAVNIHPLHYQDNTIFILPEKCTCIGTALPYVIVL